MPAPSNGNSRPVKAAAPKVPAAKVTYPEGTADGSQFRSLLAALGRDADEQLAIGYKSKWEITTVAAAPDLVRPTNQHFSAFPFAGEIEPGKRGKEHNTVGLRSLGVDLDGGADDNRAAYRQLHKRFGPPAAVVRSGEGIHLHYLAERMDWDLDDEATRTSARWYVAQWQYAVEQELAGLMKVDRTADIARVWRVPGSLHRKCSCPCDRPWLPVELLEISPAAVPVQRKSLPWVPVPEVRRAGGADDLARFDLSGEPDAEMDEHYYDIPNKNTQGGVLSLQLKILRTALAGHPGGQEVLDALWLHYVAMRRNPQDAKRVWDNGLADGASRVLNERAKESSK